MGQPAARISDFHTCPMVNPGPVPHVGGPVTQGFATVIIGNMPAARVGDITTCAGPPDPIALGSKSVYIGGQLAARQGDLTNHGGVIAVGFPTVLIGDWSGGGAAPPAAPPPAGPHPGLSRQANALLSAQHSHTPFVKQCPFAK